MPDYREWLKKGLEKDDVSTQAVAEALGVHHSAIYKLLNGERSFKANEVPIISAAIKEPIPVSDNTMVLPVTGIVSADGWSKIKPVKNPISVSVFRDGNTGTNFTAYRVAGECAPNAPVRKGDDIACAEYTGKVDSGMLVIAERERNSTKEFVLRTVLQKNNRMELKPISRITKKGSVEVAGDEIRICAVAVAVMRSLV